jgi:hypothetical protein
MTNLRYAVLAGLALMLPFGAAAQQESPYLFAQPFQIAQANPTLPQQRANSEQTQPPAPQQWSVSLGGLYTQRDVETAGWAPNLEVDYSATDRLQLHAMVPYAFDKLSGGGTHWGIGDAEVGVRYRFVDDDPNGWRPAVAFYPLFDLPTGDQHLNLGTGSAHAFLPLWFSKSLGNWTPYGGGGYWINPGTNNKDWLFAAVGVVRTINEQWSLTGELFHATSSKVGLRDQTGFSVGARVNLSANHHLVFTVGRGLENANETNQITGYAAFVLTF